MAKPESAILEAEGAPHPAVAASGKGVCANEAADDWRVAELYIERRGIRSIVGNIYKGKVDNVLPGLEAAFVDIGLDKNGFLHADDIVMPGRRGRPPRPLRRARASASPSCSSPARRSSSRRSRTR